MDFKICSGLQYGADQGGLFAGEFLKFKTGGTAPKGFLTENGPMPELGKRFGLIEHKSPLYPPRTEENVKNSDATIRFASNFYSAGEKCTLKFIEKHKKLYFDVGVNSPLEHEELANWILDNNFKILNIAGNRESTCPGIHDFTYNYLIQTFDLIFNRL